MMLHAILRAKTDGMTSAGDIVLALVSDEESGGDQGGRWLVEDHPELFAGIKYSIGEGGWFSFQIGAAVLPDHGHRETGLPSSGDLPGHRRPRIAGHTTQPNDRDSPVPTAGNFRTHVTSETRIMFQAIGRHVSLPARAGIAALFNPRFTASTLRLMGAKAVHSAHCSEIPSLPHRYGPRPNLAQPLAGAVDVRIKRDCWP